MCPHGKCTNGTAQLGRSLSNNKRARCCNPSNVCRQPTDSESGSETKCNQIEKGPFETIQTSSIEHYSDAVPIPTKVFEQMCLRSQTTPQSDSRKPFGNPTPIAIVGFVLSHSPLSCDLMGWRGAGGNGAASIGVFFFIGGLLMLLGGCLEWFMGNTFPFVVFASFGGFWLAYGATLLPFFNAFGSYSPDANNPADGLTTPAFKSSFAFFLVFVSVLCFIFLVCSIRTNLVFVTIFASLFISFALLSGAFWYSANSNTAMAARLILTSGVITFIADLAGWYLLLSMLLLSVDFPIRLPLGDLSSWIKGYSDKVTARDDAV